jgi:ubiquinone/menaquinone biosynthesis C-methylase UbiE
MAKRFCNVEMERYSGRGKVGSDSGALSPEVIATYDRFCLSQPGYVSALNQLSLVFKACVAQSPLFNYEVLEIGCGTGECTRRILESLPSGEITAIDADAFILRKATEKIFRKFSRKSVSFQHSDALTFLRKAVQSRNKWDFGIAGFTLHNWEHTYRSQVLKRIVQVLRPGGWLLAVDYFPEDQESAVAAFTEHIARLKATLSSPANRHLQAFWVGHTRDDMHPKRLMYKASIISELKTLGCFSLKTHRIAHLEALVSARKRRVM